MGSFKTNIWRYMTDACSGKACPNKNNERASTILEQKIVINHNDDIFEEAGADRNNQPLPFQ
jgi:hypothetical protein